MTLKKDETMMRVKRKTLKRLEPFGKFGESYDMVINRLIDKEEKRAKKRYTMVFNRLIDKEEKRAKKQ